MIASVVLFAEASVFLWVPVLVLGLLAGVLLAEATRPRPRWKLAVPARRPAPLRADLGLAGLDDARGRRRRGRPGDRPSGAPANCRTPWPGRRWSPRSPPGLLAEVALLRALLRPLPAEGADVPVDEALRTWTAHLVTAAATVLALLPLGTLLLRAGIDPRPGRPRASTSCPWRLVAGGFSALAAGIAVAGFLLTWLRPVRSNARALAG